MENKNYNSSIIKNKDIYHSYFDESLKAYIILLIKFYAMSVFSLGIAYPWAVCMKLRSQYHHTVISGQRMKFIGQAKELCWHWLAWWGLSVITLGIFGFVANVRMERWVTANTVFEDVEVVETTQTQKSK